MVGGGEGVVVLSLLPGGRILVAVEPVDGRKGIDSLAGVVRSVLLGDPLSGDLFVFKNKGGDKLKILAEWGRASHSPPAILAGADRGEDRVRATASGG